MTTAAVFVVHVAARPGDDHLQRCVACGWTLADNQGWWSAEGVAVWSDGAGHAGPSWWPAGALIGTDKTAATRGGMTYVHPTGRPLGADERACA